MRKFLHIKLIPPLFLLFYSPFAFSAGLLEDSQCHPKFHPNKRQFIIGYGSLMNKGSKKETYSNAGESIPIIVKGFRRGWFARGPNIPLSINYLGTEVDAKSKFNAIMFALPNPKALLEYDKREDTYCRAQVPSENIVFLSNKHTPIGEYWMYITPKQEHGLPSKQYPLVQSYIDIFLSGCFEIQEKYHLSNFAQECIYTTSDWSKHWVNDRLYPRRAFDDDPKIRKIDTLISQRLPTNFKQIKIEG
jgi:hypothetical protein